MTSPIVAKVKVIKYIQSTGSTMLCGRRLGFSGTPSDLLPLELGKCHYEKGSDGKMVYFLTSPTIVSAYKVMPGDWSAKSVLELIANPPDGVKYLPSCPKFLYP